MKFLFIFIMALMALPANAEGSVENDKAAVDCLILNAYHEARGEGLQGILLVSQVVINRADKFNLSICQTLRQPGQFSWIGKSVKVPKKFHDEYGMALLLLYKEKLGLPKQHMGVFYFHNVHLKSKWFKRLKVVTVHRNHIFYKAT